MSRPETIEHYLRALDDSLKATLSRRERILAELRNDLGEAAEEEQRRGASRREAERRAVAAMGVPAEELAGVFPAHSTTLLGRAVAGMADFLFVAGRFLAHPANRRWALKSLALLGVAYGLLAAVWSLTASAWQTELPGPDLAARALLTGLVAAIAITAFVAWWGAKSLPPPGYARRWLRLDRAARTRILRAVGEGKPLSNPEEASFAEELSRRVRDFRLPGWLGYAVGTLAALSVSGLATVPAVLTVAIPAWWFALRRQRSVALDQAEGELVISEVIAQAVCDASKGAPPDLGYEQLSLHAFINLGSAGQGPAYVLSFTYRDAERSRLAVPVLLAAQQRAIELSIRGEEPQRLRFERNDPHQLRELRIKLASTITTRWQDAAHLDSPATLTFTLSGPWAGSPLLDGPDVELLSPTPQHNL